MWNQRCLLDMVRACVVPLGGMVYMCVSVHKLGELMINLVHELAGRVEFGKEKSESLKGIALSLPSFLSCIQIISRVVRWGVQCESNRSNGKNRLGLSDKEIEEKITGLVKTGV